MTISPRSPCVGHDRGLEPNVVGRGGDVEFGLLGLAVRDRRIDGSDQVGIAQRERQRISWPCTGKPGPCRSVAIDHDSPVIDDQAGLGQDIGKALGRRVQHGVGVLVFGLRVVLPHRAHSEQSDRGEGGNGDRACEPIEPIERNQGENDKRGATANQKRCRDVQAIIGCGTGTQRLPRAHCKRFIDHDNGLSARR